MLNRNPSNNSSNTSSVLNSYRKRRQQKGPFLVYGAIALVVIGIILLIIWLTSGSNAPLGGLFATDTPTPTLTSTPTQTALPTETATITFTPTVTLTSTPSEPFPYTIQEGDTLFAIADKFNLGKDGILLIYDQNPQILSDFGGNIQVGQTILIPVPGTILSTRTPVPLNLPRGTKIEYRVLAGDTLAGIAATFNSKIEDIITENDLKDANALQVGQILQIPVNLVTATATLPPTSTPVTPTVAGAQPTQTKAPATSAAPTCAITENAAFVTQLQTLINNARTSNGLSALTINQGLTAAAKAHAMDMLCKNYFSPNGLDGATPQSRVTAQGYKASLVVQLIYASDGATPQSALDWWMSNTTYHADLLNPNTTEFGISYVTSDANLFRAYFVVVAAKP